MARGSELHRRRSSSRGAPPPPPIRAGLGGPPLGALWWLATADTSWDRRRPRAARSVTARRRPPSSRAVPAPPARSTDFVRAVSRGPATSVMTIRDGAIHLRQPCAPLTVLSRIATRSPRCADCDRALRRPDSLQQQHRRPTGLAALLLLAIIVGRYTGRRRTRGLEDESQPTSQPQPSEAELPRREGGASARFHMQFHTGSFPVLATPPVPPSVQGLLGEQFEQYFRAFPPSPRRGGRMRSCDFDRRHRQAAGCVASADVPAMAARTTTTGPDSAACQSFAGTVRPLNCSASFLVRSPCRR